MQSQGVQINQIVALAALAVMTSTASFLGKVFSPGHRSNGNPQKPEAELIKKFMQLNPEAQRGAIHYVEEMRKGYKKGA